MASWRGAAPRFRPPRCRPFHPLREGSSSASGRSIASLLRATTTTSAARLRALRCAAMGHVLRGPSSAASSTALGAPRRRRRRPNCCPTSRAQQALGVAKVLCGSLCAAPTAAHAAASAQLQSARSRHAHGSGISPTGGPAAAPEEALVVADLLSGCWAAAGADWDVSPPDSPPPTRCASRARAAAAIPSESAATPNATRATRRAGAGGRWAAGLPEARARRRCSSRAAGAPRTPRRRAATTASDPLDIGDGEDTLPIEVDIGLIAEASPSPQNGHNRASFELPPSVGAPAASEPPAAGHRRVSSDRRG